MRGFLRFLAGLILVLAILLGAAYFFREPLTGLALRSALASAGVENPSLAVTDVSLTRLALKDVSAGPKKDKPGLALQTAEAGYDWRSLLFDRRVSNIAIGDGSVSLDIAADGSMSIAGMKLAPTGGGETKGLPFDSLSIGDLALSVRAPEGEAQGHLSGGFEPKNGGAFNITGETALLVIRGYRLEDAKVDGALTLSADGEATFQGDVAADIGAPQGVVRGLVMEAKGEGASWRDALAGKKSDFSGSATLNLLSADIPIEESPYLSALFGAPPEGGKAMKLISLKGGLFARYQDDALAIEARPEAPLRAEADRGDALALSALGEAPLYELSPELERLRGVLSVSGDLLTAGMTLSAEHAIGSPWEFNAAIASEGQTFQSATLGSTKLSATGTVTGQNVDADLVIATLVKTATVGRLHIGDANIATTLRIESDFAARTLNASNHEGQCIDISRARLTLEGQDTDIRFTDGALCRANGVLIAARWTEDAPGADVTGRFSARNASLSLAKTRFVGAPPDIDFTATYDAKRQHTLATGTFAGGRIILNDTLIGTESNGAFTYELDREKMGGEASLERVRIAQNSKLPQVAPIIASGAARLADDKIAFSYDAETPRGAPLGSGEGVHDIVSGAGKTDFHSGDLLFAPRALQPESIVPAFRGIVTDAKGAAGFDASFRWGRNPGDFTTSGGVSFDGLSFLGPGRAITATNGVTGDVRLKSLWPVETDGVQSISVERLDMDALALETGEFDFAFPGDDTLYIERAEFPWFGGLIGVYETSAALNGAEADISLRAENIDITQLLEFINVSGLEGEGVLSGVLPLKIEGGKARIENGELHSIGPGAIRYNGQVSDAAGQKGQQAQVAFEILRDLRYNKLAVTIDGPLDGSIDFNMVFEGTGNVPVNKQRVRVPVVYRINVDAALLELLSQASLTRNVQLQIQRGLQQSGSGAEAEEEGADASPPTQ
ncbi:MAG: YdbH domain-containing protein [Caulobacterales bacterium]|nr:YdbH domain-containing protein [Caulobacterales bacterium]